MLFSSGQYSVWVISIIRFGNWFHIKCSLSHYVDSAKFHGRYFSPYVTFQIFWHDLLSFCDETCFLNEDSNRRLFIIFSFIFYLVFLLKNVVANKQYGGIQIALAYKCLLCEARKCSTVQMWNLDFQLHRLWCKKCIYFTWSWCFL